MKHSISPVPKQWIKSYSIFLLFFLVILFPSRTFAHVGFEESSDNSIVTIMQDPISPLVGEKVTLFFTFKDTSIHSTDLSKQNLTNTPIKLTIADTHPGEEGKDKIIVSQKLRTDQNGNASFEYTFFKQNYFDVDLDFPDKSGHPQEVGFLIQPRAALPYLWIFIVGVLILFGGIIFFLGKRFLPHWKKESKSEKLKR